MAVAKKDDNAYPTIVGISCVDGVTPVRVKFNANGEMATDSSTVISVVPSSDFPATDDNGMPIAKAVSSADGETILPWYVHPTTGAVLVDF